MKVTWILDLSIITACLWNWVRSTDCFRQRRIALSILRPYAGTESQYGRLKLMCAQAMAIKARRNHKKENYHESENEYQSRSNIQQNSFLIVSVRLRASRSRTRPGLSYLIPPAHSYNTLIVASPTFPACILRIL